MHISLFLLFWALYFTPSIVAFRRAHPMLPALIAVNLLLGWTVIGWIGCLVWAVMGPEPVRRVVIEQTSGPVVPPP